MQILINAAILLGALAGIFAMLGVVYFWRERERAQGRRNPLSGHLLRSPGQSVGNQIEDLRWDVATYLSVAMLPIPVSLGLFFAEWATKGRVPSMVHVAILSIFASGALGVLAWKLWVVLRELRRLRLGYDAELAVGQELNELLRQGYRVFHDFPVEDRQFNIDHVLVGPTGIFAIETKGRSKPKPSNEKTAHWEVTYDGNALSFPGWVERAPMRQAEGVAVWLRKWLSSAVGEQVHVQPVVILPGWYVKRTGPNGVPVLAIGQVASYFTSARQAMDAKLVQRIAHQLEQRCRDVQPRAYAAPAE